MREADAAKGSKLTGKQNCWCKISSIAGNSLSSMYQSVIIIEIGLSATKLSSNIIDDRTFRDYRKYQLI
jgi:hypothetical protein